MICGATAALTVLLVHKLRPHDNQKWSLLLTINAALAGMVAACAGADAVQQWAAAVIGCGAGLAYYVLALAVARARIDDPLDAVAGECDGTKSTFKRDQCTWVAAYGVQWPRPCL
jgi:Amt family ammonium transporter